MKQKLTQGFLSIALLIGSFFVMPDPKSADAWAPDLKWQSVHVPNITFQNINRVIWVNDHNHFVAIGDQGKIFTSPNGIDWTQRTSGTTFKLTHMLYENNKYTVAGDNGVVLTSANAIDWTAQTLTSDYVIDDLLFYFNGLIWDGTRYILHTSYNSSFMSTDAVTWIESVQPRFHDLLYVNSQYYGVSAISGETPKVHVQQSADGNNWTTVSSEYAGSAYSIAYGNGTFVVVGQSADGGTYTLNNNAFILTSNDGVTWQHQLFTDRRFVAVYWVNGEFVITGSQPSANQATIYTSTDGVTWTERPSGFGKGSIRSIAYGAGYYVAAGFNYDASAVYRTVTNPLSDLDVTGKTTSTVSLQWTAPLAASDLRVEYKPATSDISAWTTATTTGAVDVGTTSATVTGLLPGTEYQFRLRVTGGANEGYSNVAQIRTEPAPISDLSLATPTATSVVLNWTTAIGASQITVQQSDDDGTTWTNASTTAYVPSNATTATVQNLTPGTDYKFRLQVTGGQNEGTSNVVSHKTAYLQVNDLFNNSAFGLTHNTAKLTWTAPVNATSVTVEQSSDGGNTWSAATLEEGALSPTASEATVTGLSPVSTYSFRLQIDGGHHHGTSNVITVTTKSLLVTDLKVSSVVGNTVTLSWTPPSDATSVVVQRSSGGSWPAWTDATIDMEAGTATLFNMDSATPYTLRINVVGGLSAGNSNTVSVTTGVGTVITVESYGSRSASFSWTNFTYTGLRERALAYSVSGQNNWTVLRKSPADYTGLSGSITDLTPNTAYDVKLVVYLGANTYDSEIITFTTRPVYSLTYSADGNGTIQGNASQTVDYDGSGTEVTAIPSPGYKFVKWSDDLTTAQRTDQNVQADLNVTAQFTAETYDVVYHLNDGSGNTTTEQAAYNSLLTPPTAPSRAGYQFVGWFKDNDQASTQEWHFSVDKMPVDGVTLYAKWLRIHEVVFSDHDGTTLKIEQVADGQAATAPADPARPGYTFVGWDQLFHAVSSDLNVKALYNINSYNINIEYNDGSTMTVTQATYNAYLPPITPPTRDGFRFEGWFKNADLTDAWDFDQDTVPIGGVTLYAKWTVIHTVEFRDYDGTLLKTEAVAKHEAAVPPSDPGRAGYTFSGWDKNYDNVTSPLVVTAQYIPNPYWIHFNSNGGSSVDPIQGLYGERIAAPDAPERSGYQFGGWYKGADLTAPWNFSVDTVPVDGITLYAKWTATPADSGGGSGGGGDGDGGGGSDGGGVGNDSATGDVDGVNDNASASNPSANIREVLINGVPQPIGTLVTTDENDQPRSLLTVDETQLLQRLDAEGTGAVLTIPFTESAANVTSELTAQVIKAMEQQQAVVEFQTERASYLLPAVSLNIDAVAQQFAGPVSLADIKIRIEIAEPPMEQINQLEQAASRYNTEIVAAPVQFTVSATYNGTSVSIGQFTTYVERSITLPDNTGSDRITTAVVIEADGTLRHVPTKIDYVNGKWVAKINSLTNSTYALIWKPVQFKDMDQHWAKNVVNDMGSRLIVSGVNDERYAPDQAVTRAEFTAMLVRGLGLGKVNLDLPFTDVKPTDWYADAVRTAYAYELINGYEDGSFRPHEQITREQAVVMLAKAMRLTGLSSQWAESAIEKTELKLQSYTDASHISDWAKASWIESLRAGLLSGRSANTLAPQASMTRAEVAVVIRQLLQQSGLI